MNENRNVYVGHRYVPKIMGEWKQTETYEGLSIVIYEGNSYTSKKRVPVGVSISNDEYWSMTGNYNAQIEEYRQDVKDLEQDVVAKNEEITKNVIMANSLGAKGDNATDNFSALLNVFKEASSDTLYDTTISSNRFFTKTINIPTGVYRIKQPNLLLDALTTRTQKLVINGNGSTFVFEGFEGYAFENNDKFLDVDIYNLNLTSLNDTQANNRSLIRSESHGGAQAIRFHQCSFEGKMKYGIDLQGTNTNSEWVFNQCSFSGEWDSFLYIAPTNTSDQFLNYWFNNCKYWTSSNWITAYKGGHFKLNHCDVSGYTPTTETYLFKLLGGAHSMGVTTFIDDGTRYELKSSFAKVIKCEWDNARISFENCDMGSNGFVSIDRKDYFHFANATEGNGSNYTFTNCVLLGTFKLQTSNVSPRNNLYLKECVLLGDTSTDQVSDIFNYFNVTNPSEFIKVNLINTKYKDDIFNMVLNGIKSSFAHLKNNAFVSQSSQGLLLSNWMYKVSQETLINDVVIQSLYRNDGNSYQFVVKSDVSTVASIPEPDRITVNANKFNFYIGNRVTIGKYNTIYTITGMDVGFNTIVFDKPIEDGVVNGDTISFAITDMSVKNNSELKFSKSNGSYLVNSNLYLKSYGTLFPDSGIGARIIVKTLE